jgi:hypothetical protein
MSDGSEFEEKILDGKKDLEKKLCIAMYVCQMIRVPKAVRGSVSNNRWDEVR